MEFSIGSVVKRKNSKKIGKIVAPPADIHPELGPEERVVEFVYMVNGVPTPGVSRIFKVDLETVTAELMETAAETGVPSAVSKPIASEPQAAAPAAPATPPVHAKAVLKPLSDLEASVRAVMAKGAIAPESALPAVAKASKPAVRPAVNPTVDLAKVASPAEPIVYLNGLFEPDERLCVQLIHATELNSHGTPKTHTYFQSLEQTTDDAAMELLRQKQNVGWQVYVAMSPFLPDTKNRLKKFLSDRKNVYFEVDEDGDAVLADVRKSVANGEAPAPRFILESSPHHYQFSWHMEPSLTLEQQESLNEALCARYRGDSACTDGVRVFRVPGFYNLKPKYQQGGQKPPLVKIIEQMNQPSVKLADFKIPIDFTKSNTRNSEVKNIAPEKLQKMMQRLEDNCEKTNIALNDWTPYEDGFKNIPDECPCADDHITGDRGGMAFFVTSKGYGAHCYHNG
jgi:RepB DNA-primase from phage plasmid